VRPHAGSLTADLVIAAVVFCLGTWLGVGAVKSFREAGGRPSFYQTEFGPAVMFACGRGLQNPDPPTAAAIAPFLSELVDRISCADLPSSEGALGLDPFQRTSRYLELTVGWIWRIGGISWSRLSILHGAFFGAVGALSYGLFRIGLTRSLSVLGLVPVFMSTPNLDLVPHLRDYSKGPFLLGVMLIMAVLVVRTTRARDAIAWSALGGAVVGLGLGFRTDLINAMLPFVFALAFLLPALPARARAAAIAVFLGCFAVVAYPLLGIYSRGNNIGPVALLGLTKPFDRALGIRSSIYEYGGQYNDSLIFSIVNSYAVRIEGRSAGVDLATPEHASASMKYVGAVARTFPADFVTRTLAATRMTPRYFLESSLGRPPWIDSRLSRALYWFRGAVSSRLAPLAVPSLVLATIVVSMANPSAAWLIIVLMAAFAGGSAIQFHERHFFYLQLLPWWAFGVLVQTAVRAPALVGGITMGHVKRAAVFSLVVTVAGGAAVALTRMYQQRSASALFEQYARAPRDPIPLETREAGPARTLLTSIDWLGPLPPASPRVATRFLAVRFRDRVCSADVLPLTLRYESVLPELDFSEPTTVRMQRDGDSPTILFFAAYDRPDETTRFRGIELATEHSDCIDSIVRVDGLEREPLLLTTVLSANWRREALYQRLQ
jgi:hypothetical protein